MPGEAVTKLLQEHVVASLLKQARLHEALPERVRVEADLDAGTLRLAGRELAADVIGTESLAVGTFVWGWANPSTPTGPTAEFMRRLGEERTIAELTDDDELAGETMNAGVASLIAAGVADLDGYFLSTQDQRVVAFALRDAELRERPVTLVHFPSAFFEIASVVAFDHRRAFAHYLARPLPGVPAAVERGEAVLRGADATLAVRFDEQGRVGNIRVEAP